MKLSRLLLILGRHPTLFEKVDADVGITFAVSLPEDRSLNRLNRLIHFTINAVGAIERLASLIDSLELRNDRPDRRTTQAVCLCRAAAG